MSIALNAKVTTAPILFLQGENSRFLSIEMVKRRIRFVWNLGGETTSVTHPLEIHVKNPNADEAWYHIEANRTMNLGTLMVRQDALSIARAKHSMPAQAASSIEFTQFFVVPNNRLWIGGVPDDIRPKELMAGDVGLDVILNHLNIDGNPVGLWQFVHQEGECSGAAIRPPEETTNGGNTRHFNGAGYAVVSKQRTKLYRRNLFALQISFKTFDENALLFLAVDEAHVSFHF